MFAAGKTAGAAGAVAANYIEDVFSTYLYTGTGTTQTITNGINLATNGGLVWGKVRSTSQGHIISDTVTGKQKGLTTNSTAAQYADLQAITSFNSNGFTVGTTGEYNLNGATLASWTFREQPKFFDIVTFTGNSTSGRQIAHNLNGAIGTIIVKNLTNADEWLVWHRSLGDFGGAGKNLVLNSTAAVDTGGYFGATSTQTSTYFTVNADITKINWSGNNYVAYLFAHDAGGFGLTGTDNVISCGSFVTTGSVVNVTLGYEPQFLLVKRTDAADDWRIIDSMRGFTTDKNDQILAPNLSAAETNLNPYIGPTATGFSTAAVTAGRTYIYIAIRRGPMKVPTLGTSVFGLTLKNSYVANEIVVTSFAPDMSINKATTLILDNFSESRLTGGWLIANSTVAETSGTWKWDGVAGQGYATVGYSNAPIYWSFRRAPGFFDVVCYTGTGANRTVAHNLAVVPEMMIVKSRSAAGNWGVWNKTIFAANSSNIIILQSANASTVSAAYFNSTAPSSTTFTLGTAAAVNGSGATLVAYLFATCAGVSKVGSYTGTGALQTVACGFTTGARFVLIKRTDSTGDWYVWDSARGITSGNDPYLLINSTAAEVTATNYVDTDTTGFKVTAAAPAALNAVGGTFLFLAIA